MNEEDDDDDGDLDEGDFSDDEEIEQFYKRNGLRKPNPGPPNQSDSSNPPTSTSYREIVSSGHSQSSSTLQNATTNLLAIQ